MDVFIIALRIHMSPETQQALLAFPEFIIEDRGEIPIKVLI